MNLLKLNFSKAGKISMPKTIPDPLPQDEKWYEKLTKGANGIITFIGAAGALIAAVVAFFDSIKKICCAPQQSTSGICQFKDGWIDYSPYTTLNIGVVCQDGTGGVGQIVTKGVGAQIPVSSVCQFITGWHDYAPALPYRVGTPCQDGRGSSGKVIIKGTETGSPL